MNRGEEQELVPLWGENMEKLETKESRNAWELWSDKNALWEAENKFCRSLPKIIETFVNTVQEKQGLESTAVGGKPLRKPSLRCARCAERNPLESWAQLLSHCRLLTVRSQTGKPRNVKSERTRKRGLKSAETPILSLMVTRTPASWRWRNSQQTKIAPGGLNGEHAAKPGSTAETDGGTLGFV